MPIRVPSPVKVSVTRNFTVLPVWSRTVIVFSAISPPWLSVTSGGVNITQSVGAIEALGEAEGEADGAPDGLALGEALGFPLGEADGLELGLADGLADGVLVGLPEGAGLLVGPADGAEEG